MMSAVRRTERPGGWIVSLGFWLLLLAAAALYALAALSPKLLVWVQERSRYRANQVRLVALERQVRYLERVGDALENEPAFAAALARADFDAMRPGEERIAMESSLTLKTREVEPAHRPRISRPWYASLLTAFVEHEQLSTRTLVAAAVLAAAAFTFFHEPQSRGLRYASGPLALPVRWLNRRYTRPERTQPVRDQGPENQGEAKGDPS